MLRAGVRAPTHPSEITQLANFLILLGFG